ncbi:alpha/beta fold hydrolase [Streptomyces lycii]|uniref:alpha/beta fold hydrolase n=1 Tax=Streptomyces lycii TaxID=2654337 RepID=UPI001C3F993A|nr:alpha/beta hydrolase [Streptomyces lycii]
MPATDDHRIPTYVLVHGSNSNSSGWAAVQRELALRGHRTLAVDLPGHGFAAGFSRAYQAPQDLAELAVAPSPLAGVTLADNVEHVTGIVRRVAEHGPVILVGHSLGGLTVSGVATEVPELIDRLVYATAWCCTAGPAAHYAQSPENATSKLPEAAAAMLADPSRTGVFRLNWRTADPEAYAALKAATFAEGSDAEVLAFLNTLEPDESAAVGASDARIDAGTLARVPHSYIRFTADESIPVALQDRFIKDADALTPEHLFDVHTLEASHVGPLARPEEFAGILAGFAVR